MLQAEWFTGFRDEHKHFRYYIWKSNIFFFIQPLYIIYYHKYAKHSSILQQTFGGFSRNLANFLGLNLLYNYILVPWAGSRRGQWPSSQPSRPSPPRPPLQSSQIHWFLTFFFTPITHKGCKITTKSGRTQKRFMNLNSMCTKKNRFGDKNPQLKKGKVSKKNNIFLGVDDFGMGGSSQRLSGLRTP